LLVENDWACYFSPNSVDAILAEHVWEHLTSDKDVTAARNCFKFLKAGEGYLRAAVPDGLHPNPDYVESVMPGGSGSGAKDHKVLYTYRTFPEIFDSVGFEVFLLEYFDELGDFHHVDWNPSDGVIQRSRDFDPRNVNGKLNYTSIILDARKPK
jgi:predicted SAM-dependent methyltransferase